VEGERIQGELMCEPVCLLEQGLFAGGAAKLLGSASSSENTQFFALISHLPIEHDTGCSGAIS
jgi:hypothetical protein